MFQLSVRTLLLASLVNSSLSASAMAANLLPDTGQTTCYDRLDAVECPASGADFYGQDAQQQGNEMNYSLNADGTVTDNVTGIQWQADPDTNGDGTINASDKLTYNGAQSYCENLTLADYDDWQLPSITQLYSLIDFAGEDISNYNGTDTTGLKPFINTAYFAFAYGDTSAGERLIDSQYASSTLYTSTTANDGGSTLFGVNFADGRIKGYGLTIANQDKTFFVMCVRSGSQYGIHQFVDNGDNTVTDDSSGLMWAKDDSGMTLDWEAALAWAEQQNAANYLGYSDWRLPNIKELQNLVDYTRSPDATNSAAIDPLFNVSTITNEAGVSDYPYYWSSTTHPSYGTVVGGQASYVSFGRAMGYLNNIWQDVHGAGAQRSDPKSGNASDYPQAHGPQGDAQRVFNYARLVRDAGSNDNNTMPAIDAENLLLLLPTTDVEGKGTYYLKLHFVGFDARYGIGLMFELVDMTETSGTATASYNMDTALISVPSLVLDGVSFRVELSQVADGDAAGLFAVTVLEE